MILPEMIVFCLTAGFLARFLILHRVEVAAVILLDFFDGVERLAYDFLFVDLLGRQV